MTINNITYLNQFIPYGIFIISDPYINSFKIFDILEITKFLKNLEEDKIYVVSLEFIYCEILYDDDTPTINISEPILITKNSNPRTISNFIKERVKIIINSYFLDDNIMEDLGNPLGPEIRVKYREINIF